jgi:hypothetical protein
MRTIVVITPAEQQPPVVPVGAARLGDHLERAANVQMRLLRIGIAPRGRSDA